jgi:transcription initiation factor IIF auxiliary subunit
MALRLKQDSKYVSDDWWQWSVELEGPPSELDSVRDVVYTLHPTFPNPVRRIRDRKTNFRLEDAGWGEFEIRAEVVLQDGATQILKHDLELCYEDGTRTLA